MRPTVLLFDIDGTLITCGGAGRLAMEAGFRTMGGSSEAFAFSFGGRTDRSIVREGLQRSSMVDDDASIDRVLRAYLAVLPDTLANTPGYSVLPGVFPLLDALESLPNIVCGLGTGNVLHGAACKLAPKKLFHRFAFGGFGSDHEDRGELLARGALRGALRLRSALREVRVVVIGDTPRDVDAAKQIGAESLAVATGAASITALQESAPTHLVDSLEASSVFEFLRGES